MTVAVQAEAPTAWRSFAAAWGLLLRRMLSGRFMIGVAALAAMPVVIAVLIAWAAPRADQLRFAHATVQGLLRFGFLHFAVFFGACLGGFSMMRQDREQQTLHYLLLAPISRWTLAAAALAAYLIVVGSMFVVSFWLTHAVLVVRAVGFAGYANDLIIGNRWALMLRESTVLGLAVLIYGAIAMMMANVYKTPFYALPLLGWELAVPYLPSTFKHLTASHYLFSLLPERPRGAVRLLEMLGDPAPPALGIAVLVGGAALFFVAAAVLFNRSQCLYGDS